MGTKRLIPSSTRSTTTGAFVAIALGTMLLAGCGHTRALIRSRSDIYWTSSSEYLMQTADLPLEDWPKLRKFTKLSDLSISSTMEPQIVDDCLVSLSRLNLPKLTMVRLECSATDRGLGALTNLPSITGLQLSGPHITDSGIRMVSRGMPQLNLITFYRCTSLTVTGYVSLTNLPALHNVEMSVEDLTQDQIERIITELGNVKFWVFDEPKGKLSLASLKRLKGRSVQSVLMPDGTNDSGVVYIIKPVNDSK